MASFGADSLPKHINDEEKAGVWKDPGVVTILAIALRRMIRAGRYFRRRSFSSGRMPIAFDPATMVFIMLSDSQVMDGTECASVSHLARRR